MDIKLKNGKMAIYKLSRQTKVPDISTDEEVEVHVYHVPCPVCGEQENNIGHSQDGILFLNNQIICRSCGVFFRPVVCPEFVRAKMVLNDVVGP